MIGFFSTGCPQCKALKMKLDKKNIEYELCMDEEIMKLKGLKAAPAIELEDGSILGFADAVKWVNAQ